MPDPVRNTVSQQLKIIFLLPAIFFFLQDSSAQVNLVEKYGQRSLQPAKAYDSAHPYFIVRWNNTVPLAVKILRQFDDSTAIIDPGNTNTLTVLREATTVFPANDDWKMSPAAEKKLQAISKAEEEFILTTGINDPGLFRGMQNVKVISVDHPSRSFVIRTTRDYLREKLLPLKEVIFADIRVMPKAEIGIIGYNRSFHGLSAVDYAIPGANGKNIVVGVKEQKMEELDLDLYKRVLLSPIASSTVSNHSTVVSSIIGGAGNSFYDGRGIANGCSFFPSSFANLFPDDAAVLSANKVTTQNHSYGTVIQQFYGAEAVSYDEQTWQNKTLVHVFSAGNQGTAAAPVGPYANIAGYGNITGNFKMAKNIITTGAMDNAGHIPAESSSGPVYDGRVAPQLIALGPNGTSDAAAVVSGTVAVLQQVYADSNSQTLPPASLIKALLYNNADDIFRTHIDYKTGYGLLNSYESVRSLQQKLFDGGNVGQSQVWTKTISIPANCAEARVTLCWTDTAALPNNNKALVNDLDLELINSSNGTVYKPWVLDATAHADSLAKPATRKRDSLNTAEQVSISLPAAGDYQVRVTGHTIPGSPIDFHVAFNYDILNTFQFISPQHTADVNPDEDPELDIRWKTFVADTNQAGSLFISYDAGINWQLIKSGHKLHRGDYQWPVKDTSSRAQLKMETSFGDYFSNEFIISRVTRMNVDFLCTDSFRLSWNSHIYAGSYDIFTLIDSPYLKKILNVSDSFVVLNRNQYPSLVYAVQPVLTNGLPAARSVAQDISFQGVNCFYRTLYYTIFDENKLELTLELSAPGYTDSIFFEQVSANGQLLKVHGNIKSDPSGFVYSQLVDSLPTGTSYWRARIKLKTGAVVYTEIISIVTSGNKFVVFYPNPSRRSAQLQYVLKQGVPGDSRLQLFDINGRLVRDERELSGSLNTMGIPAGLLFYKLVTRDGHMLETGKLLIVE